MKAFKIMMAIGGTLAAIGLIIMVVFLGLNGWQIEGNYEMKKFESKETITSLEVELNAGKLEIEYTDGDGITVEYPETERVPSICKIENGTLRFETGKKHWYNFVTWFDNIPATKICVPQKYKLDLDVHLNAGSAQIAGADYNNVKITLNAGTLEIDSLTCPNFTCELNTGSVITKDIGCEKFFVKLNAGNFECDRLSCPDIEAKVNAGEATVNISGKRSEYNVYVEKNAGSCSVSSGSGTTDKKLNIKVNAGNFEANFAD